jgi:hypothetical protein
MSVTISSTTDTPEEVQDAIAQANEEPSSPVVESAAPETAPVEGGAEPAETTDAKPIEASSEPEEIEAVGEIATEDDEVVEAAAESEEETEAAEEDAPESPLEQPKKKRRRRGRSYKDRASQLAREKGLATARADALAQEVEDLRRRMEAREAPPQQPVAPQAQEGDQEVSQEASPETSSETAQDGKPKEDDFETYTAYQEALVQWTVSKRLEANEVNQRERIAREQQQRAQHELVAAHHARIDEFREANPNFDAIVEAGKDLPLTRPMQDAVLNSDAGPALMFYLCQNPEECDQLAQMHPMAAIKEMGKLEARLETAQSTGPVSMAKPITRAPRPIKPVGGGVTTSSVPMDQMSYQDFKRARERQLAAQNER